MTRTDPFKEEELAARWQITTRTLQGWRKDKKGPAFIVIGNGTIRYRVEDVLAYETKSKANTEPEWRGPVKRAASALDVLAKRAVTPEAKKTLSGLRDELVSLLA